MKLNRVLLRWYKSFNISYRQDGPARLSDVSRPWNVLDVTKDLANDYPFIEIPIEGDITTIVGGNESGKSHLLGAISKVIDGKGLNGEPYDQTDLCRYATTPSLSTSRWPQVGLQFEVNSGDLTNIHKAVPASATAGTTAHVMTLILAHDTEGHEAFLYFDQNENPYPLAGPDLKALRETLPRVRFIDAQAALPDTLSFNELMTACYKRVAPLQRFNYAAAQKAAQLVMGISANQQAPGQFTITAGSDLATLQAELAQGREDVSADARLAATLFTEVLGVPAETLEQVFGQPPSRRGYIQYFLKYWNDQIIEKLDLSHYWQQDDQATLELVYKDYVLYFDITDKTAATYTFKERSSGLRFFLSYYLQAKALELTGQRTNSIILMDEPDSFLSIIGQRNILAVFESLIGFESTAQTAQLIYTTHSPFLINRNFPRRIRVVTKEEAEEGTQYVGRGASRRYEPVRSALGIDCAQTLFMGSTNLVLEGLTDQFLINEMIRVLVRPDRLDRVIDLNAVVVVSADGVNNVEKVLSASQWGDEPIPATTVLLDGDDAGKDVSKSITGNAPDKRKLVDEEFVKLLDETWHESLAGCVVETIEDLVPRALYRNAFREYVKRWHPKVIEEHGLAFEGSVEVDDPAVGNVKFIKKVCGDTPGLDEDFDKLGVLAGVVDAVRAEEDPENAKEEGVSVFVARMFSLFEKLNGVIDASRLAATRQSMATNVKRIIREFLRTRTRGCSVLDLRRHLQRLMREARTVDEAGEQLRIRLESLDSKAEKFEVAGQGRIINSEWASWRTILESIKRNPLQPLVPEAEAGAPNHADGA